jgi:hypothetical protein
MRGGGAGATTGLWGSGQQEIMIIDDYTDGQRKGGSKL